MRRVLVFLIVIVASLIACSDASKTPQPVIGPGVQHNMGELAAMMKDLHLLMFEGPLTAKQSTEVSDMMLRVSVMMKEMSGPQRESLAPQHEQELKEMRRRLETIREMLKTH
jgi:hypothetical protein